MFADVVVLRFDLFISLFKSICLVVGYSIRLVMLVCFCVVLLCSSSFALFDRFGLV